MNTATNLVGAYGNAFDRARLRQANRLFSDRGATALTRDELMTLEAADIRASRVFEIPEDEGG